ncbi:protein of unknown function [Pilibacter termitis]|uniref:Uncharacterized protein n=1 Tax=Pilibacter termitis TaxID=263852 RepID=A0A1T4LRG5_9ENTE|nr:DUF916 and DUF3324 domain-containing protein [Pilibacter termitis]SJZ57330.1 protein of unknown function [Pilibacter termitis]
MGMKNKLKRYLKVVLIFALALGVSGNFRRVFAADKTGAITGTGFTYELVFPENQTGSYGYYDLKMAPDQKQELTIKLNNPYPEEIKVDVIIDSAKTGSNGVIDYNRNTLAVDKSLKHNIKDIVKAEKTVTIPPKSKIDLPIKITMPKVEFDGVLLGSIYMERQTTQKEKEQQTGSVRNIYSYSVGLLLRENDKKTEKKLELNGVKAGLDNYRNSVILSFSNVQPEILPKLSIEAEVMKKGSKEVLWDTRKTDMRMAPNSLLNFPVSMQGEAMTAGKYTAHIIARSEDKKWEWNEDFEITQEQAEKYNQEDVGLIQERGLDWKLIVIIVVAILLLFLLIFLVIRRRRKKEEEEKREELLRRKKALLKRKRALEAQKNQENE